MKLFSSTVLSVSCLMAWSSLANDKVNDGAGPSNPRSNEEICMTNENIEIIFNIIFGLNVNYNGNNGTEEILPETTMQRLNVLHIIYQDQFRILFNGIFRHKNMAEMKVKVVHFFQRVLLRAEEFLFETSRSPNQRREIDYIVNVENCSVDFFFDCRLTSYEAAADPSPPRRCHKTVNSYQKNGCIVNTIKLAEHLNQSVPWNINNRFLDHVSRVLPCVLFSRLRYQPIADTNRHYLFRVLRSVFIFNFWVVNIGTKKARDPFRRTTIISGLEFDLQRMISDDFDYFEQVLRSSTLIGHRRIDVGYPDVDNHLTAKQCIINMWKALEKIFKKGSSNNGQRRFKRFASTTNKLEVVIRQRLMDLAFVSLKDQTEANELQKSFEWSKDFNQLYNQFLRPNWTNTLCPNSYSGFDNFLYSKFSQNPEWYGCIFNNVSFEDEWCMATKRIFISKNLSSPRSKQFLKDQSTIYKMLNNQLTHVMTNKTNGFYMRNNVFKLASIFLSFAEINPCFGKVTHAERKKDLHQPYNDKWYIDSHGRFQCL